MQFKEYIQQELSKEFYFYPLAIAAGIVLHYSTSLVINVVHQCLALMLMVLVFVRFRQHFILRYLSLALLLAVLGYLAFSFRERVVAHPVLNEKLGGIWIEGRVVEIAFKESSRRVILEELRIDSPQAANLPRIKVTLRDGETIRVGDRIAFRGDLMPPPGALVPDGFDYRFYAYFKEIAAIGYSTSHTRLKSYELDGLQQHTQRLRQMIGNILEAQLPPSQAAIAKGMLIGDPSGIDEASFDAIRKSGIAHIIAISGMHIVVVIALIFFLARQLLSRLGNFSVTHDIKKVAAVISLIVTFAYLQITGSPVSAERAYLMSAIVLLGVIIEREPNPQRGITIAAIFLLIVYPESLFSPGLQMSFAACYTLIACYNSFALKRLKGGKFAVALSYLMRITISTLVAGMATAPFVVFHFYQFSTYSILTNLLAIPLSDFIIMPLLIVSLPLMPLGLEQPLLWFAGTAIELMRQWAIFISGLPFAAIYIPPLTKGGILLYGLGLFLLCVMRTNLRLIAIPVTALSVLSVTSFSPPDLIVDSKIFAFREGGLWYVSSKVSSRFARKAWAQYLGIEEFNNLDSFGNPLCHDFYCELEINGRRLILTKGVRVSKDDCEGLVFNLLGDDIGCDNLGVVPSNQSGPIFVWAPRNQEFRIKAAYDPSPWGK